ncbi:uncharacterized protein crybg2 isoform X2 [Betta splendens]|uniref:Uncharacterized protein crybg2 isoform X2 n=1 Tax=Betta splendens TaxID=158456 RepID=A0A6P7NY07_BETSP|nr:uncharacterized protein crybg2 isoform X2 [Betta splendens]
MSAGAIKPSRQCSGSWCFSCSNPRNPRAQSGLPPPDGRVAHAGADSARAVEVNSAAEDGEDGADAAKPKSRSRLYATAPRSKSKEFSYSELDLRKPKRFATFSFGFGKRKKKDGEKRSKSTYGLDDTSREEKEQTPLDLRPLDVDESRTKFMSQPELDTGYKFDIPSPPPVAAAPSESPFTFPRQAAPPGPVSAAEPPANSAALCVVHEPRAPIASIPELQLDEDELTGPDEAQPATSDSASSGPASCAEPSGHVSEASLALSPVCSTTSAHDDDILQQTRTETQTLHTVTSSHRPAEAPAETFLQSVEPELYTTIADSPPVEHKEPSHVPGPASISSANSRVKTQPVDQDGIYRELYDSLFPQGFISAVGPETGRFPKPEPVVIRTFYERHTETDAALLRLPASHESSGCIDDDASFSSAFTSHLSSTTATDASLSSHIQAGSLTSYTRHSELSCSHSGAESDDFSLFQDTVTSALVQNAAPPVSHHGTSRGADAQVTDSKRRVILVKELVTDEASSEPDRPDRMSAAEVLEVKTEAPCGPLDVHEGPLSPAYLSVGSDDGSAMEMYYSAEEDNSEESRVEEMYTVDEREDVCVGDVLVHKQRDRSHEGGVRGIIVKIQNEGGDAGNEAQTEDSSCRTDVQPQPGDAEGQLSVGREGPSQQKAAAAAAASAALAPSGGGGGEARREESLATPVEQVNTPMVCEAEPRGRGEGPEGNRSQNLETEAHLHGQEQHCVSDKDPRGAARLRAAPSDSGGERVSAPALRQAADEPEPARGSREASRAEPEPARGSREASRAEPEPSSAAPDPPPAAELASGPQTPGAEPPSRATRSEGADPIAQSVNRNGPVHEQVAVEPSASDADAPQPASRAAEVVREGQEARPDQDQDQDQGSPAADSVCAAQESDDNMSKVYSSLSTKLSIKSRSLPKEDESKHRVRKVSLISEAETSAAQDAVDAPRTSSAVSNGTDSSPQYKWKNKFDGVTQFKPSKPEGSLSPTFSSPSSLSPPSSLCDAPAYDFSSAFSSSSFAYSTSLEEHNRTEAQLTREREPAADGWRRSLVEREEPPAPAGGGERGREAAGESERLQPRWDSPQPPTSRAGASTEDFTGVFKATLVDLVPEPPAPPSSPPDSPDVDFSSQFDMDNLVDTLKSMGPSLRPRAALPRAAPPSLLSSLPPIDEDTPPAAAATDVPDAAIGPAKSEHSPREEPPRKRYTLPPDLGLRRTVVRDNRTPAELMKQNLQEQQLPASKGLNLPLRSLTTSRNSSDVPTEELKSPVLSENGVAPSSIGSRLDNSIIFRSYRSSSTEDNGRTQRPLLHANSLPEAGPASEPGPDAAGPRFERFSFLSFLTSSSSSSGSLTGADEPGSRVSRPPSLSISSSPSSSSPTRLLSPAGSVDLQRPFASADAPLSVFGPAPGMGVGTAGPPLLQRSFSSERTAGLQQNSLFNSGPFQSQEPEPERSLTLKYRAFPDAYLTKQKEHGKLNPRPGKMYIFDQPGMCGQRIEIRGDVIDATPWELQETISIRVVRGGWVLYEKPDFKGEKIALDEGDIELTNPFLPPGAPTERDQRASGERNGETEEEAVETKPALRFIIGSVRRAVRDYSVPEISLFPEENAEGKKVIFRDTTEDARIFGFPVKAHSIIINAGLWLVYAQPFFQGVPRVLEVGGYSNPAAWGVEQPYVASVHPLKIGEPRVEYMSEPKIVIYEKSYFTGKSRTITTNMRDFMTRTDRQQNVFMYNVASLKVLGGIWVGYEKEGFRGHQYLLEEGDFHDWRVWGGHNPELRSIRLIRADLTDPLMLMMEQPEEELDMQEENTLEVTEAVPDVEPLGYKTSTRSIHVISGAWVAYSHVDYSGNQYILEKGFYSNCADWGSEDNRICSVQPILLAQGDNSRSRNEIILYSEPDFQGNCHVFGDNQTAVPEKLLTKSCRVAGESWVLYANEDFCGNQFVLSEGDYPSLTSMGCPPGCTIRSVRIIPMTLSVPSISLFGLECLEGREITVDTDVVSMVEEGYNNHVLSVKVSSGCWVICEHSNYRGRQFLLEPIEITNWPKFSSMHTIGSMYPVRQKRHFFHIKNTERGHYMSIQGGVEELRSGRVVVTPEAEPMSDVWFYQDGLIKNKLSPNMSLQVMGNVEPGSKLVLWSETRQPIQTWTAQTTGLISSLTFPGFVMDVKGGKSYDKDHVVIMPENEERPSQQWEIELL